MEIKQNKVLMKYLQPYIFISRGTKNLCMTWHGEESNYGKEQKDKNQNQNDNNNNNQQLRERRHNFQEQYFTLHFLPIKNNNKIN